MLHHSQVRMEFGKERLLKALYYPFQPIIFGSDHKMCIYTDNVCNEGVFQISFPQFV